jgi:exodeoxyribonuclease VII large subunit
VNASESVIGVAELDRRLKRAVESASGTEWVEGEIASLKLASSGHAYFSLRDEVEDASVDCVMYRFNAQRAKKHLADGTRVQVHGRATLWAPRGRLQFVVETLRPAGRGALLEALERLKEKLAAEGLFAAERKRPLPAEPRIVGVVTSASGAAFHDIRTVAFRRGGARLVLAPALVQGEGAPASLIAALDLIERYPGLDVVIFGRGGGSGDDLMAFNDERVVRRLAAMRVPVVSAVGHEIDTTLSDLVADVRAATPSQAAELVVPDAEGRREVLSRQRQQLWRALRSNLLERRAGVERLRARLGDPRFVVVERQQSLDELQTRLERHVARLLARQRSGLEAARARLHARHPRAVLAEARAELAPLTLRLEASTRRALAEARSDLEAQAARLDALSPLAVLSRGYAIATTEDGKAIRSHTEVAVGDRVSIRVSEGRLSTRVEASFAPDTPRRGES